MIIDVIIYIIEKHEISFRVRKIYYLGINRDVFYAPYNTNKFYLSKKFYISETEFNIYNTYHNRLMNLIHKYGKKYY